jgi:DNA-binding transcriptional LysR family regulator
MDGYDACARSRWLAEEGDFCMATAGYRIEQCLLHNSGSWLSWPRVGGRILRRHSMSPCDAFRQYLVCYLLIRLEYGLIPELRQLRYFVAVAEELHFTRAAKRLNIAQPPLSHQIRQLEAALRTQLLVRTSRKVELTLAGAVFLRGARRALVEAERAAAIARRAGRGELDTLRVGFTDSAALSILPGAIRRFRREFPEVHLELQEDSSMAQVESIRRDLVDLAIVRGPTVEHTLRLHVLLEEPFWVALSQGHHLARRTRIKPKLLAEVPMIAFPRHLAPIYHDTIMLICHKAGFVPDIAYEAAGYHTMISLVAAELGVSIVPESVRNLRRAGVTYRALDQSPVTAQLVAVHRPQRGSVALERFLVHAVEEARAVSRHSR